MVAESASDDVGFIVDAADVTDKNDDDNDVVDESAADVVGILAFDTSSDVVNGDDKYDVVNGDATDSVVAAADDVNSDNDGDVVDDNQQAIQETRPRLCQISTVVNK